jgi:flagellar hook-associated protein 2
MIAGLRSSIMSIPAGLSGGNYYQSAAELGLKTNQDGTLSLDTTALGAALDTNPEAVANVFNQVNTNFQNSVLKITLPGSGSLALIQQNIQTQNSSLDLQIDSMQNRLNRQQQILQTTYANLESTVGQLQSAGQSLSSIA